MNDSDFEGTLVLEKLATISKVEEFFDAIDSDDFAKSKALMMEAKIDVETIAITLNKMQTADGEH